MNHEPYTMNHSNRLAARFDLGPGTVMQAEDLIVVPDQVGARLRRIRRQSLGGARVTPGSFVISIPLTISIHLA